MAHPKDLNYPHPTSEAVTAVMKANKRANTRPEVTIRSGLHRLGFRFRKDYIIKIDKVRVRPDIVFTKLKLAVFIDGCFWHLCPEHGHIPKTNIHYWEPKLKANRDRDILTTKLLRECGWNVLRLWEHVTSEESVKVISSKLTLLSKSIKNDKC